MHPCTQPRNWNSLWPAHLVFEKRIYRNSKQWTRTPVTKPWSSANPQAMEWWLLKPGLAGLDSCSWWRGQGVQTAAAWRTETGHTQGGQPDAIMTHWRITACNTTELGSNGSRWAKAWCTASRERPLICSTKFWVNRGETWFTPKPGLQRATGPGSILHPFPVLTNCLFCITVLGRCCFMPDEATDLMTSRSWESSRYSLAFCLVLLGNYVAVIVIHWHLIFFKKSVFLFLNPWMA